jgi:hypothetical protein
MHFQGVLAGPTRLELATSGVTGRRSNQTELRPRSREKNYSPKIDARQSTSAGGGCRPGKAERSPHSSPRGNCRRGASMASRCPENAEGPPGARIDPRKLARQNLLPPPRLRRVRRRSGFHRETHDSPLGPKGVVQLLPHRRVVDVRQLAPVGEAVLIGTDPLDRLLLQLAVVLPRRLLHHIEIDDGFVPGLLENGDR